MFTMGVDIDGAEPAVLSTAYCSTDTSALGFAELSRGSLSAVCTTLARPAYCTYAVWSKAVLPELPTLRMIIDALTTDATCNALHQCYPKTIGNTPLVFVTVFI